MRLASMSTELARDIAKAIRDDICGRRALRQAWDEIDPDIRDEIIDDWTGIVEAILKSPDWS